MKNRIRNIQSIISNLNTINPITLTKNISGLFWYNRTYKTLKNQRSDDRSFNLDRIYPIISDRFETGGIAKGHYFHQDLYVARMVYESQAKKHVDVGSRVDGFVAHVAVFREIEVLDIRPLESKVQNIKFKQMDCMDLPDNMHDYCDSISSLHAIEHFGLGRYGDPIDYYGHLKAIRNITSMLKPKGIFYFSVPIGPQRIEFNAHRVFSISNLIEILSDNFQIESFSYVDDVGDLYKNVELSTISINNNFGCKYGCGIFVCSKV